MSPISIVVIGHSGQVATALESAAKDRGVPCVCCGRPGVDLSDAASLERFILGHRPGFVVNAAAYTAVDKAEAEPDRAFAVNERGPELLAELTARIGVPLLHLSTDYVFDGSATAPYREDDPIHPLGVYGASKAAGEKAVRRRQPHHIILRTSWVYSATGTNFVRTMLSLARERDEVSVVDDQRGSPTYAGDLAAAILDIALHISEAQRTPVWGTYHVTGRGETTWCGFAREIFSLAQRAGMKVPAVRAITTTEYPAPAKRPVYSVLDNTKVERTFGLVRRPWQDALVDCMHSLVPACSGGRHT